MQLQALCLLHHADLTHDTLHIHHLQCRIQCTDQAPAAAHADLAAAAKSTSAFLQCFHAQMTHIHPQANMADVTVLGLNEADDEEASSIYQAHTPLALGRDQMPGSHS